MPESPSADPTSRRSVLASLVTGGTALAGGCMGRLRSMTGLQSPSQVTVRIKTVPADADPYALKIARHLAKWYRAAGIDAGVVPMAEEELLRQVLLNHEFDVFVARAPRDLGNPDALLPLLHSQYATALGWQNPFGYANLDADELLETQRRTSGTRRREAITDLQRTIARTQPFTVIAFPDAVRACRSDRYTNWRDVDLGSAMGYLRLTDPGPSAGDGGDGAATDGRDARHLRVATTDRRATESLNPLAVEYRRTDLVIDLLYDSLGYASDDGTVKPWLAASWTFTESDDAPVARVHLREGATWHDGEPLTAADVAFTYRFLADTSGEEEGDRDAIPAPRFQGRSSLVAEARPLDDRTLEVQFVECDPLVATRAFTVPVLPEHVWTDRMTPARIGGVEIGAVTEALVTNNVPPVGSGPFSLVRNTPRESLTLERFDEHFLAGGDASHLPPHVSDGLAFDRLTMRVVGSGVTAVELVVGGEADLTATAVSADIVPRIGRASALDLLVSRSPRFYFVGYNARRPSLTNPRFRNALARLVDKAFLVEDVFDGYARAAASPLAGTDRVPTALEWDGADPSTPFLGTDGELDVERARDAFRDAGYRYDDGTLLGE